MQIRKRSGALEDYAPGKITAAMSRAFASVGETPDEEALAELVAAVSRAWEMARRRWRRSRTRWSGS